MGGGIIATQVFTKRLVVNQLRALAGEGERIVFGLMLVVLICNFSSVWAQRKRTSRLENKDKQHFSPDNAVLIYSSLPSLVCLPPLLAPSPSIATSLPPSRCWNKQNKVEHCFLSLLYLVFAFMWINSLSLVFLYLFSLSGELAVGRPSRHQETTRAESSLGESAVLEGGDSESELTNTQQISRRSSIAGGFLRCATAVWGSAPHVTPIRESKQTLAINLKHNTWVQTELTCCFCRGRPLIRRSMVQSLVPARCREVFEEETEIVSQRLNVQPDHQFKCQLRTFLTS